MSGSPTPCPHCGLVHETTCPRIKSIEYYKDGSIKKIEFHLPTPLGSSQSPPLPLPKPNDYGCTGRANGHDGKTLSATEARLLEFLALGDSNKTIARKLGNREATVKVHVKSILRKLGVHNRTQAAAWFVTTQPPQPEMTI